MGVPEDRRLVAILAADVAGSARLVGADEHGTLRQWTAHREELIEPSIKAHHGRIVRVTGDGLLVEFVSIVNAIRCAIALQHGMAARNAGIPPHRRIEFRIGINVGDIIVDRTDIWGEGVNVAARLEAMAEPGGIYVSALVHDYVLGRLDIVFEDLGERQLKNVARPVQVYRVRFDDGMAASPRAAAAPSGLRAAGRLLLAIVLIGLGSSTMSASLWLAPSGSIGPITRSLMLPFGDGWNGSPVPNPQPFSIVVLPFVSTGGNASQDELADGITDSLTSDLSRALPGSFVVSRGTAFTYKWRVVDPRQVGRELDVRYLLAGSVMLDNDRIRVNAQLVETATGWQLWTQRFDTERQGLLQVQDEIVGRLSRAVGLEVVDLEARRSERERPGNPETFDLLMRGKAVLNRPSSPATMMAARELFDQALDMQPDNAAALAGIATTLVFEFLNGYYDTGGDERLHRAETLLDRALTAEPRHLMAMKAKSALLRAQGRFDDAIAAASAVIAENPGEPWAYKEIGLSNLYVGRTDEALAWFAKAERIGPRDPGRWTWFEGRGHALILLGRDEEAVRVLLGALEANPKAISARAFLAAAYALGGRPAEARAALAAYDEIRPGTRVSTFRLHAPVPLSRTGAAYRKQRLRLELGLRQAGMPE